MTDKLYYDDVTLLEFSATLLAQIDTGHGTAVRLDRSAFYPTSGGQPHDTGTLNAVPVVDVWEDDQGEMWHLLPQVLDSSVVTGRIDKARRLDHMQQHSGQHLLSAGFYNLCDANTIGFHLGTAESTIDLDIPELSWETAAVVEIDVNTVVWENRPVTIHYATQDNLDQIPLRKPPAVTENIRVIWVKGYDASACGGTHVQNTGEVGQIKISGIERYKGGVRVAFLCGKRALVDYQNSFSALQQAGLALSVARTEVPEAVYHLQDALAINKKAYNKAQSALLDLQAEQLWLAAPEIQSIRSIVAHWTDRTFADIRRIANQLRERPRTFLLMAVTEGNGVRMLCARSNDLPAFDARQILGRAFEKLDGHGGDRPCWLKVDLPSSRMRKFSRLFVRFSH